MERLCFLLKVKEDLLDDYLDAHDKCWPEMLSAMHDAGIRNYSMFHRDDGTLVGYLEAENIDEALRKSGETDVSKRWGKEMLPFFEPVAEGYAPLQYLPLKEYFYTD